MATKPNRNIKVSQATIDKIKKQGMTASLKSASSNNSPEYREALRRMYGDARVAKATASTKPSSSGRYVGSIFVKDKPAAKAPTGGQPSGYRNPAQAKKASTSYSPRPYSEVNKSASKPATKKAAASKSKENNYGGFSMAGELLRRAYAKTPKAKRDAAYAKGPAAFKKYLAEKNK
jgi:hypothetical protein